MTNSGDAAINELKVGCYVIVTVSLFIQGKSIARAKIVTFYYYILFTIMIYSNQ